MSTPDTLPSLDLQPHAALLSYGLMLLAAYVPALTMAVWLLDRAGSAITITRPSDLSLLISAIFVLLTGIYATHAYEDWRMGIGMALSAVVMIPLLALLLAIGLVGVASVDIEPSLMACMVCPLPLIVPLLLMQIFHDLMHGYL